MFKSEDAVKCIEVAAVECIDVAALECIDVAALAIPAPLALVALVV